MAYTHPALSIDAVYAEANRRFVDYYLAYARLHSADDDALKEEEANLLKALSICEQAQWWEKLCPLVRAVHIFLIDQGYWNEFRWWLEIILRQQDVVQRLPDRALYLELLNDYAALISSQGERERAKALYEEVIKLAEQQGLDTLLSFTHYGLGTVFFCCGQLEQAKEHWQAAVNFAENMDRILMLDAAHYFLNTTRNETNLFLLAEAKNRRSFRKRLAKIYFPLLFALHKLKLRIYSWIDPKLKLLKYFTQGHFRAMRYYRGGQLREAEQLYLELCTLGKQLNDQQGVALALFHLGDIARMEDRYDEAIRYYRQSEQITLRMNDHTGLVCIYAGFSRVYLLQNRFDLARPYLEECVRLESEFGETQSLAENLFYLGYAAANTDAPEQAEGYFRQARAIFSKVAPDWVGAVDRTLEQFHAAFKSAEIISLVMPTRARKQSWESHKLRVAFPCKFASENTQNRNVRQDKLQNQVIALR